MLKIKNSNFGFIMCLCYYQISTHICFAEKQACSDNTITVESSENLLIINGVDQTDLLFNLVYNNLEQIILGLLLGLAVGYLIYLLNLYSLDRQEAFALMQEIICSMNIDELLAEMFVSDFLVVQYPNIDTILATTNISLQIRRMLPYILYHLLVQGMHMQHTFGWYFYGV